MKISFNENQIIKETEKGAIIIEFGEYKLSISKCFLNNNTFMIDNNRIYWIFKENIKKELTGKELKALLKPYLNKKPIKQITQLLEPLKFYHQYNAWYIGEIKNNQCFKYNITWKDNYYNSFIINQPYKHNDLPNNYIVTSIKDIATHNEKIYRCEY